MKQLTDYNIPMKNHIEQKFNIKIDEHVGRLKFSAADIQGRATKQERHFMIAYFAQKISSLWKYSWYDR